MEIALQFLESLDKFNRYCLIKYEDLVNDTEKTFLKILKFIAHLGRLNYIDKDKFRNTLETLISKICKKWRQVNFVKLKMTQKQVKN